MTFMPVAITEHVKEFSKTFLQISSACIPSKTILIREKDKPWFNNEIRKEIRIRDRLREKLFKSQNENNIIKYKKNRNMVNNMKKIAKEKFENNLDNFLLNNSSNPKMYWKIMKMLIKSKKGNYCIPPLHNSINDQNIDDIAYDDSDKCELLNKHVSSISKLNEENAILPQFDSKTNNIIHEIHIIENEIINVIQILDPNKATGPHKISHKMLKISPEEIAKPLLIIFNKSLQQRKYPSNWKSAHAIAIFKKGDTSLPSNYRPISLISCVGKLMERIVYKHVYNHLVNNNLIYKYQSGFLPQHSTVHQLLELHNSMLSTLEKK